MPRRGQSERLSRLQKEILKYCKEEYLRNIKESGGHTGHFWARAVSREVSKNLGMGRQIRGKWDADLSFSVSFSRSIRNLIKKGIIIDSTGIDGGRFSTQISYFRLTDKGKTLMLTLLG